MAVSAPLQILKVVSHQKLGLLPDHYEDFSVGKGIGNARRDVRGIKAARVRVSRKPLGTNDRDLTGNIWGE